MDKKRQNCQTVLKRHACPSQDSNKANVLPLDEVDRQSSGRSPSRTFTKCTRRSAGKTRGFFPSNSVLPALGSLSSDFSDARFYRISTLKSHASRDFAGKIPLRRHLSPSHAREKHRLWRARDPPAPSTRLVLSDIYAVIGCTQHSQNDCVIQS